MYGRPTKFPTFKDLGLYVPGGSRKNPESPWVQPSHVLRDGKVRVINRETDEIYKKKLEQLRAPKNLAGPSRPKSGSGPRKRD